MNAVKLNGKWELIDVTWNSAHRWHQICTQLLPWLFSHFPEKFVYTHFPENSEWQLISPPHSFEEFSNMPYLSDRFFALGLILWIDKPARILDAGAEFKL